MLVNSGRGTELRLQKILSAKKKAMEEHNLEPFEKLVAIMKKEDRTT